jgi:hypothetical protein
MPEKSSETIGYALSLLVAFLTWAGFNFSWTHRLQTKVNKFPEKYIMKTDFNHRIDRLEDAIEKSIGGVHERMDKFTERRK